ncbi:tyrosine-type recombinase/integrase [Ancylobacter sp. IITR112]|uniref:tyrosine-type recombinase/integrase n=1 Tax=Ancylobacter sp. IITR112 TaxID=3138073 RepID=UPI00352A2B33
MASVAKREWTHKGETKTAWVVRYTDQGGKRRMKTFEKKKDADRFRSTVETEIENGTHVADRASKTVKEAAEGYLLDCERRWKVADRMAGGTLHGHISRVNNHIIPNIGHMKIKDVTSDRVQFLIDDLSKHLAKATISNVMVTLIGIIRFSIKRRWITRNVLRDDPVQLPQSNRKRRVAPSKAEISTLLEASSRRLQGGFLASAVNRYAIVRLGVFGGLRLGEMCALRWEDIDIRRGVIHVRHSRSRYDGRKCPKSRAGVRSVPLTYPVYEALCRVARLWRINEFVDKEASDGGRSSKPSALRKRKLDLYEAGKAFSVFGPDSFMDMSGDVLRTARGTPARTNISDEWRRMMEDANLVDGDRVRFTIHSLRHAAASLLIEAGLPAMNLKTVIGHASVTTTYNVYGHLFPEDERTSRAAHGIAAAFGATRALQEGVSR